MVGKAAFIVSRFIEAALIVLGIVVLFTSGDATNIILLGWDVLALCYLVVRIRRLRRAKHSTTDGWLSQGIGGRAGLMFTIFTSVVGIGAGLSIVATEDGAAKVAATAVGVPAVLFAWAILHFGYAERYAKTYYAALPEQVLSFPNVDKPTFVEFAYFSFTLGTTFSVSDVETQSSGIRLQILSHSILSFVYNTVSIGIAVSVISG
jgi:uncharacterized membrane protein